MAKPLETQCKAILGTDKKGKVERCPNEITFDKDADTWVIWCDEHLAQETVGRATGSARPERVSE